MDSSSNTNAPDSTRKVKRITKQAAKILHAAFKEGMRRPTIGQKRLLWEQITAMPDCAHYQIKSIDSWFLQHRSLEERNRQAVSLSTLYPSINRSAFKQLQTLFGELPNPSEEVVVLWAKLLRASIEDVTGWIEHQKSMSGQKEREQFTNSSRLLTPSSIQSMSRSSSPVYEHEADTSVISALNPKDVGIYPINKFPDTGLSIKEGSIFSFPNFPQSSIETESLFTSTLPFSTIPTSLQIAGPSREPEPLDNLAPMSVDQPEMDGSLSFNPSQAQVNKDVGAAPAPSLDTDPDFLTYSNSSDEVARDKSVELDLSTLWAPSLNHLLF